MNYILKGSVLVSAVSFVVLKVVQAFLYFWSFIQYSVTAKVFGKISKYLDIFLDNCYIFRAYLSKKGEGKKTFYSNSFLFGIYHRIEKFMERKAENSIMFEGVSFQSISLGVWKAMQGSVVLKTVLLLFLSIINVLRKIIINLFFRFGSDISFGFVTRFCLWLKGKFVKAYSNLTFKNIFFGIVIAYPLTDYIFRTFTPFGSYWEKIMMICVPLALLAEAFREHRFKLRHSYIGIAIGLFMMFSLFLFFINSPDVGIGFEGLRMQVEYMLWFFVVINYFKSKKQIYNTLVLFIWTNFIVAIYGIYQYIVGVKINSHWIVASVESYIRTRVFSFLYSCNVLGSLFVLVIPITIAVALNQKSNLKKAMYFIIAISMALCLVFTYSRMAWIACAFALIFYAIMKNRNILIILAVGLCLTPVLMPSIYQRMSYMFTQDYANRSADGGRIQRWNDSFSVAMEEPFVGQGLGRFGGAVAHNHWIDGGSTFTDNYYLKVLCEMGFGGLGLFIFLLIVVIRGGFRAVKSSRGDPVFDNISIGIYAGLLGIILHNSAENVFENNMMNAYFWIFLGMLLALRSINEKEKVSVL